MSDYKIYVACLAAYNNGHLHGKWIDVTDTETMEGEIKAVLAASPIPDAEEYAIHDYQLGGASIGEYEALDDIVLIKELIEEHGEIIAKFQDVEGLDWDQVKAKFEDCYQGKFNSITEYAEQFVDDTGLLSSMPDNLRGYFDYDAYGRDMRLGGDIYEIELDGDTHIFLNH